MSRAVARIAWIVPVALFALTLQQAKVAKDLNHTLEQGQEAQARVLRYFRSDRKDVTHAEVDLQVVLADGSLKTWEKLALPYSVAHRIDERDSVEVRISLGSPQEVVIQEIGKTQLRIAMSNAAMVVVVFLMALVGVWAWNRQISRQT
ncbi:MAG: hypothetical protein ACI9W4_001733 [Rhodothermales bacterium]|jgi:hypothetical protein